MEQSLFSH